MDMGRLSLPVFKGVRTLPIVQQTTVSVLPRLLLALDLAEPAPLLGTASAFSAGLFVSQGCHGFEGGGPTRWRVAGSEGDRG
jgi:hypothetical protein